MSVAQRCVARRVGIGLMLGAACALVPSVGAAQASTQRPLTESVVVEAGASCLQQARLVEHIATWLGRGHVGAEVRVLVRGDASEARKISFELVEGSRTRTRVFDSVPEICGDMHAVVGLAIALAIDAEAMAHIASTDSDSEGQDASTPLRRLLTLQGTLAYEVLPELSLGGQLGAEIELLSWLSARVDGLVQHSRGDTIADSNGTFDATLVAGALLLCTGGRVDARLRLGLCSGLASGAVYAKGQGFAPNRSDTGLWLSVRSGVRFEIQLATSLMLMFDLDVVSSLVSPRFETGPLDAAERVRTPSSTALELRLGPAIVF